MISVSKEWKKNHEQNFTNRSFIEVSLTDDIENREEIIINEDKGTDIHKISEGRQDIMERDITPNRNYGTMEVNRWILNGQIEVPVSRDEALDEAGLIMENIGEEGKIVFEFNEVELLPAICIVFDKAQGEFAKRFTLKLRTNNENEEEIDYDLSDLEDEGGYTVVNNDKISVIIPVMRNNVYAVEISNIIWSIPNRRIRISNLYLGVRFIWRNEEIIRYHYRGNNSPILTTIPSETVTVDIDNFHEMYDPENPEGVFELLQLHQLMKVRYGYQIGNGIEWIVAGTWFISEFITKNNGNVTRLVGRDGLSFLSGTWNNNQGGETSSYRPITQFLEAIVAQSDMPMRDKVQSTPDAREERIRGTIPETIDRLELLQMLCQAGNIRLLWDYSGGLTFTSNFAIGEDDEERNIDYTISQKIQYEQPKIQLITPPKNITVTGRWETYYTGTDPQPGTETAFIRGINVDARDSWRRVSFGLGAQIQSNWGNIHLNGTPTVINANVTVHTWLGSATLRTRNFRLSANGMILEFEYMIDRSILAGRTTARFDVQIPLRFTIASEPGDINHLPNIETTLTETISTDGRGYTDGVAIENRYLTSESQARNLAIRVANWLSLSKEYDVYCRVDPRVQLGDIIEVENKYGNNVSVQVTTLEITYDGQYVGRVGGVSDE